MLIRQISHRARSAMLVAAVMGSGLAHTVNAQTLDAEETVKTIVGSDVDKVETSVVSQQERIEQAIKNSRTVADRARKLVSAESISLISVSASASETASIEAAVDEHKEDIAELRQAIEGSAILFHAIDSEDILLRNVVAMEISDSGAVTIFATGAPASN